MRESSEFVQMSGFPDQPDDVVQKNQRIDMFKLYETDTMRRAMDCLERNGRELACVCDCSGRLVGVLSNGDIRRATLSGIGLDSMVVEAMNSDFVAVSQGTPREQILKMLDSRIKAVPVIDDAGVLVDLVVAGLRYVHVQEGLQFARARAPARIGFAGGGTDFTAYFIEHGGLALTATIQKHARATLCRRDDQLITIHSYDNNEKIVYSGLKDIIYNGSLDLIKAGIKVMEPAYGFDLYVASDLPAGSGLGGSAALLAAVIGAFNELRDKKLNLYEIAEHSFEAERVELGVMGGWQDQYATVFGGFNFLEFTKNNNIVSPLRLQRSVIQELEERCILCDTGRPHKGQEIQIRNARREASDANLNFFADEIKSISQSIRSKLLRGNLDGVGNDLDATWMLKRQLDPNVRDSDLDEIYNLAMAAGCEGGRLLGTGGGGMFLFFTKPFERFNVMEALRMRGLEVSTILFDDLGLQSWTSFCNS